MVIKGVGTLGLSMTMCWAKKNQSLSQGVGTVGFIQASKGNTYFLASFSPKLDHFC